MVLVQAIFILDVSDANNPAWTKLARATGAETKGYPIAADSGGNNIYVGGAAKLDDAGLEEAFTMMDKDGNGEISREELELWWHEDEHKDPSMRSELRKRRHAEFSRGKGKGKGQGQGRKRCVYDEEDSTMRTTACDVFRKGIELPSLPKPKRLRGGRGA